jgi:hypothetical protein
MDMLCRTNGVADSGAMIGRTDLISRDAAGSAKKTAAGVSGGRTSLEAALPEHEPAILAADMGR